MVQRPLAVHARRAVDISDEDVGLAKAIGVYFAVAWFQRAQREHSAH
jgi:hypothetical protein